MTSKKIYLIRHGQTAFNRKGIVQGSGIDSSLDETGFEQAEAFFDCYGSFSFDKVYTSELKRSQQSVDRFIAKGIPHTALSALNEINWGNKEGTQITIEEDRYYRWLLSQWQEGNTSLRIEGGESPEEVAARQQPGLHHILSHEKEKNILVCMHGRAIRVLLCQMLNYPLAAMDIFEHQNLGLYVLNFTGRMFAVEKYNDSMHLEKLKVKTAMR